MDGWDLQEIRDMLMCDMKELMPNEISKSAPASDAESWRRDRDLADAVYASKTTVMTPRQRSASYLLANVARCGLVHSFLVADTHKTDPKRADLEKTLRDLLDSLPTYAQRYARHLPEKEAEHLMSLVNDRNDGTCAPINIESSSQVSGKLPWGNHETRLLRKLAQASDRFWKLYDPSDPTTAPTNVMVIEWLVENGISDRVAEIMATILRADDLRPGPRK